MFQSKLLPATSDTSPVTSIQAGPYGEGGRLTVRPPGSSVALVIIGFRCSCAYRYPRATYPYRSVVVTGCIHIMMAPNNRGKRKTERRSQTCHVVDFPA